MGMETFSKQYLQGRCEGVYGVGIQVIRSLIQQEHIAGHQRKRCQGHACLFTPLQVKSRGFSRVTKTGEERFAARGGGRGRY